jgi:hypothetical protein
MVISHMLAALKSRSFPDSRSRRGRLLAAAWAHSLPRATDAYRAAASLFTAEHPLDFGATHLVKVVWNRELSSEETEPAYLLAGGGVRRRYLDLTCPLFLVHG